MTIPHIFTKNRHLWLCCSAKIHHDIMAFKMYFYKADVCCPKQIVQVVFKIWRRKAIEAPFTHSLVTEEMHLLWKIAAH